MGVVLLKILLLTIEIIEFPIGKNLKVSTHIQIYKYNHGIVLNLRYKKRRKKSGWNALWPSCLQQSLSENYLAK